MSRRIARRRKVVWLTLFAGSALLASCGGDSPTDTGPTSSSLRGVYAGSDETGSLTVNLVGTAAAGTLKPAAGEAISLSGSIAGSDLNLAAGSYTLTGLPTSGIYASSTGHGAYLLRAQADGASEFALCATYSGMDFGTNLLETGRFAVIFTTLGPTGVLFQDNIQANSPLVATPTTTGFAVEANVSQTSVFGASGTIADDSSSASGTFTRGAANGSWTATRCL